MKIGMKARTWESIEEFYINLFDGRFLDNIVLLVRHIRTSDLSRRLFATTSLDRLIISIYDPLDMRTEALLVRYDHFTQKVIFEYYAQEYKSAEFVREYPPNMIVEKFDNFVKMIRW